MKDIHCQYKGIWKRMKINEEQTDNPAFQANFQGESKVPSSIHYHHGYHHFYLPADNHMKDE